MSTRAMTTSKGNPAKDQFISSTSKGQMFCSYGTNIAFIDVNGNVTLDKYYWDYSVTTGKYRNRFLEEGISETRKKIKSGKYSLSDLSLF